MKYILSLFTALVFSTVSFGQVTGSSNVYCEVDSLRASVTGGIIPTSAGITADDGWSSVFPIGFTFNFYGTPYTQCIIGSNGAIGFDLTYAGAYNTWPIGNTLLASTAAAPDMVNCIAGPWCDIYIPAGGSMQYSMQGTAPFRNFAMTWCGTRMFDCTTQWVTTQIILYETTNIAEVHIGHHTFCTVWNGGYAEVGVKNAAGTSAVTAPGRDYPANWNATNEAWRFSPIAGPTYSVTSIPYGPIPYAASAIYWYDSTTNAYLGTGPAIGVSPSVPTTYTAAVLGCSDTTKIYIHALPPGIGGAGGSIPHIDTYSYTNPTLCGVCDGTITLHGVNPHQVDTVFYSFNGVQQPNLVDSANLDSTITLSGLCGGVYNSVYVKVGTCPSNTVGPITLPLTPPIQGTFTYDSILHCDGDQLVITNTTTPGGYSSYFSFGDGSPVDSSGFLTVYHTYADNLTSYTGTYTVTLIYNDNPAHDPACATTATATINFYHPVTASFTSNANAVCQGTPIDFTGSTVSYNAPSYSWNFGDGSPVVTHATGLPTDTASYVYPVGGKFTTSLTVTDSIGCSAAFTDTFDAITLDVMTTVHDTSVCLRDSMALTGLVTIVPSYIPYNYSWTPTNDIGADSSKSTNFMSVGTFVYTILVTTPPLAVNPSGCSASDTEKIQSYPPVTLTGLTASPQVIPFGGSAYLNANGAVYYNWTPNNGSLNSNNVNDPIATPVDSTTIYTVYGMNTFGCRDSATITVILDYTTFQDMPTGFTPNGDGLNDVFRMTQLKYQKLVDFSVFNRWGQRVFHTANPEDGWDGTFNGVPQDVGTYSYEIIIALPGGNNKTYKGVVTLLR